ncbi:MAG: DUF3048 domain-containing protein [Lachnospiraceae bacterium]|nr:DUF3048 domain-containing protein [Lachnospiraceae bacterium]
MKKKALLMFMALCMAVTVPGFTVAGTEAQESAAGDNKGTETTRDSAEREKYSDVSVLTGETITPELASQRPIAVMFPIDKEAQPQYGLRNVDVFYEIIEEGNMSRQMGIIQDWQNLERIGNIRSIRSYFVYEALEWDPIIIHYGGPVDYTKDILTRKDVDNINGVGGILGSDYGCFYRIPAGSRSEHTAYTDAEHIKAAIAKAGFETEHRRAYYNKKHFTFAEERNTLEQYNDSVSATQLDMKRSFPVTGSSLTYKPEDGKYYKTIYGEPQCDAETGEQMAFDNVLIQRAHAEAREEGSSYLRVLIEEDGKDGFFITGGRMIHVTWEKGEGNDYKPTTFYDDNNNEIRLNKGKTMIFIIRDDDSFVVDGTTYDPEDHETLR